MMKLQMELKDETFHYDFEVGKEKGHGDHPLSAHGLKLFMDVVYECHKSWMRHSEEEMQDIRCYAYLEKHPEVVKKYIELEKKRSAK